MLCYSIYLLYFMPMTITYSSTVVWFAARSVAFGGFPFILAPLGRCRRLNPVSFNLNNDNGAK